MDLFAEPADIFHGLGFLFQNISKALRLDGDRSSHELRDVVALQQLTMIVRIGTRYKIIHNSSRIIHNIFIILHPIAK